jgi:lactate racemase
MLKIIHSKKFSGRNLNMKSKRKLSVCGEGAPEADLSNEQLREIVDRALAEIEPGAKVLAIIPDKTRDDNTHLLFPLAAELLSKRKAAKFDALVAQGTHPPMSETEKYAKIGLTKGNSLTGFGNIFDHQWSQPDELVEIGTLNANDVHKITHGLLNHGITLTVNRLLAPENYDTILIFGGTVPHEVAGFAGGAKYFFPGIAGPELTHATHWLGALVTIEKTIGQIETPTRHLIEAAADFVSQKVICLTTVVTRTKTDRLRTHALFAGDFRSAFRRGAEISREVHIKYTNRKYKRVIALLDEHYDDLWVGGKASYKLGGIIEDGGELIIYAPHLHSISETHHTLIEKYGYSPLETIRELSRENEDLRENLCVAAHLTHVSYGSRLDADGNLYPKYKIILATQINRETCRKINLGYLDCRTFSPDDYKDDPDTLVVERAGRDLFLPR